MCVCVCFNCLFLGNPGRLYPRAAHQPTNMHISTRTLYQQVLSASQLRLDAQAGLFCDWPFETPPDWVRVREGPSDDEGDEDDE